MLIGVVHARLYCWHFVLRRLFPLSTTAPSCNPIEQEELLYQGEAHFLQTHTNNMAARNTSYLKHLLGGNAIFFKVPWKRHAGLKLDNYLKSFLPPFLYVTVTFANYILLGKTPAVKQLLKLNYCTKLSEPLIFEEVN